jgi:hypothetical protein
MPRPFRAEHDLLLDSLDLAYIRAVPRVLLSDMGDKCAVSRTMRSPTQSVLFS